METIVSELLPQNIYYDSQLRVDFSFKFNNNTHSYDQSIISIPRGENIDRKLQDARENKEDKYAVLSQNYINFAPIILSARGSEDSSFQEFKANVNLIADRYGKTIKWSYFLNKLSVTLAYYNGKSLVNCYSD